MSACGTCGRPLPEDPNELENIIECEYCDEIFCSSECLTDHQAKEHAGEAVVGDSDEEEERRR